MDVVELVEVGARKSPWKSRWWPPVFVLTTCSIALAVSLTVSWQASRELHTLIEAVATVLALIVGALSLVRFFSRRTFRFLFIGAGFLGTAFLDAYHCASTSDAFVWTEAEMPPLVASSWLASRLFLCGLLWLSSLQWRDQGDQVGDHAVRTVFLGVLLMTAGTVAFFSFAPIPRAYYPELVIHRPTELVPGILALLALGLYLWRGSWRTSPYEFWLVQSLLVAVTIQLIVMPFSNQLFDVWFNVAHLLKLLSYCLVLVGLIGAISELFRQLEAQRAALSDINLQLQSEIAAKNRFEEGLKLYQDVVKEMNLGLTVMRLEDPSDATSLRLVAANPSAEKLAGLDVISKMGQPLLDAFPLLAGSDLLEIYQGVVNDQTIRDLGEVEHDGDGNKGVFSVKAFPLPNRCVGVIFDDISERKRTQIAIRERESQLAEAQRLAHLGSWSWEVESGVLLWSDELYRIFGYVPRSTEISFEFFIRHIPLQERDTVRAIIDQALEDGSPFSFYHRIRRPDGEERILHGRGRVEREADGRPRLLWGTAQDVTDRRRSEEQLQQRETQLAQAQRLAHLGHWDWHLPTGRIELSDELARIFGMSDVVCTAEEFRAIVHPEDRDFLDKEIQRSLAQDSQFTIYFRIIRSDGTERIIHGIGNPKIDPDTGEQVLWGTGQDLTEQQRAEEALRSSELRFRSVTQTANDAIVSTDSKGVIVFWNRAATRIFGITEAEALGRPATILMPERTHHAHKSGMQRFLSTGEARVVGETVELTAQRKGGEEFPIELSLASWESEGGQTYFTAMIRDITVRKKAEEELLTFSQRLEASNRELQDFAYIASHDLQEPLRKIQAFGDRLQSRFAEALPAEAQDYLRRMDRAAARMKTLISDLLTLSRITTRGHPFETIDLQQIVEEVLGDLEILTQDNAAEVIVADPLPKVEADGLQMRQLFQNLLSNAIKFRRKETAPRVEIRCRETQLSEGGRRAAYQIEVIDNGVGFDEKYLDRIFQPFQRLHGRFKYEGTGIGLAICRKIVVRHEGVISASSRPGEGATFRVILPVSQSEGTAPRGAASHPQSDVDQSLSSSNSEPLSS